MIALMEMEKHEFDGIFAVMEQNFIPDELRDYAEARRVLNEPAYHIFHVVKEGEKVGFITVWCLDGVTFAEHFVIYERFRNGGFGAGALAALQQKFDCIVLEVEHPDTPMKARRLAFYKRNGFFENDYPYFQPAYRQDGSEVPLILMSYPAPLESPAATAAHIRREVYKKAE